MGHKMDEFTQGINWIQPKLLLAYAKLMVEFCKYLDQKGTVMNYRGRLMTSTSSLSDWKREAIEEKYKRFSIRLKLVEAEAALSLEENRIEIERLISQLIADPAERRFERVSEIANQPSGKFLQSICAIPGAGA